MDPLIERAADGANRDAPRRKAFIVINFTRMVKQAQAADKQRREKKDAIQHTMKERGDDGRDGSWLLVFYSRVLRDSSSHLLLIITHAAEKERGRGRIALETQDRWKKKSHSSSRWLVGPIFFSTLKATSKRASASSDFPARRRTMVINNTTSLLLVRTILISQRPDQSHFRLQCLRIFYFCA